MTAIVDQGSYTASTIATIFTATAECTVSVSITNKSGSVANITEISRSAAQTTDVTGFLRGDYALADDGTIEMTGIVLNATTKYLLLTSDQNLNYVINGATH